MPIIYAVALMAVLCVVLLHAAGMPWLWSIISILGLIVMAIVVVSISVCCVIAEIYSK